MAAPDLGVKNMVGEIAALEYAGDAKALACVVIDRDGDIRIINAFQHVHLPMLIAETHLLQRNLIDQLHPVEKVRD